MTALSPRQHQTLALIADGHTDAQIAAELNVGLTTARRHVYDLRIKLGARNRAHAVAIAYRTGVLDAGRDVTHWVAPDSGVTGCCRRTVFELPGIDRLTTGPSKSTCEGTA